MSIVCAISGEVPDVPCISQVSGHVFEKRLLEKWIEDKGTDPVNNEPLSMEQTVDLKNADTVVRPRAPAWTSVPGILKALQDEWDSLMLHQFSLREQLQNSRQELSHTLYQHDAACRVIARLQRETAEAKEALAELRPLQEQMEKAQMMNGHAPGAAPPVPPSVTAQQREAMRAEHAAAVANQPVPDMIVEDGLGEDMDTEDPTGRPLSEHVTEEISKMTEELTKMRKKRHKNKDAFPSLATQDEIANFSLTNEYAGFHSTSHPGILDISINEDQLENFVLTAGADKTAILFDMEHEAIAATLKEHTKKVTRAIIHPAELMGITSSVDQTVKLWALQSQGDSQGVCLETFKFHRATVTDIAIHPCTNYMFTCGLDGVWNFVNLPKSYVMTSCKSDHEYTCAQVHPDGRILATGTQGANNSVLVWDISERQQVHAFEGHTDAVTSISFSDNGYYMASGSKDGTARIWDLRKLRCKDTLQLAQDQPVQCVEFDNSGSYLAASCGNDIQILTTGRQWNALNNLEGHDAPVTGLRFGQDAKTLFSCGLDGKIHKFKMNMEDLIEETGDGEDDEE